jgi:nucleotidyltransferase/DNA polymerase involved in DNA repair
MVSSCMQPVPVPTQPAPHCRRFGERVGAMLWGLCRGLDPTPITPQGPPKAITTEDSFKSCTTMQAAQVSE